MEKGRLWGGRYYYSLDCYLKEKFGEKLYKLALDGGMTCPNRDGKISHGGCIFCSEGGSGEFAAKGKDINTQIENAKQLIKNKYSGSGYIAYFQSYTNTYADVGYLKKLFYPVIMRDDIRVLSIATRPDCLENDKIRLIEELCRIKPVWVELGLQTTNEATARLINRGYSLPVYDSAVKRLKSAGAEVITHAIIGLPNETYEDMEATVRYIADSGADGIKLQLLHILKNTVLCDMYNEGLVRVLTEDEYVDIVCRLISVLPPDIVVHRLTGDGDKRLLIAPLWSCDKRRVLNKINHRLKLINK